MPREDALPADWADSEASLRHVVQKSADVVVVVHAVDWHPMCVTALLAAREVAERFRKRRSADAINASVHYANQDGQWAWAKHFNLVIGTPCVVFHYRGKQMRLDGRTALEDSMGSSVASTAHQMPRNDKFVGHFSASMLEALIESALATATQLTADPAAAHVTGIKIPRTTSYFAVRGDEELQSPPTRVDSGSFSSYSFPVEAATPV
eukprot:TRINITY_DN11474_c0_g1_i1.p1 TRINITY_DN11474_c0_g1~~TRINITY_DN11474_c0_g1_i1.p1  ORF type:complete len:208 (+),score=54.82 TRINITY_DN11474_c0_g1_i1:131-754(+)